MIKFSTCVCRVSLAVVALIVGGCSSPQTASTENFKRAIQTYHDAHGACVSMASLGGNYRTGRETDDANNLKYLYGVVNDYDKAKLFAYGRPSKVEPLRDTLTDLGYLVKQQAEVKTNGLFVLIKEPTYLWFATEKLDRLIKIDAGDASKGRYASTEVCDGRVSVTEVIRFTDPAQLGASTFSEATYRWRAEGLGDLFKNPEVAKRSTDINGFYKSQSEPKDSKTVLVKHNDGWRDHRMP